MEASSVFRMHVKITQFHVLEQNSTLHHLSFLYTPLQADVYDGMRAAGTALS